MRQGEPCHLERDDVDLEAGALVIADSKFGKSRLVFLHPTAVTALSAYEKASKGRGALRRRRSTGFRWYAWSWLAAASRRCLLIRRHLRTGKPAFHFDLFLAPGGHKAGGQRPRRSRGPVCHARSTPPARRDPARAWR